MSMAYPNMVDCFRCGRCIPRKDSTTDFGMYVCITCPPTAESRIEAIKAKIIEYGDVFSARIGAPHKGLRLAIRLAKVLDEIDVMLRELAGERKVV